MHSCARVCKGQSNRVQGGPKLGVLTRQHVQDVENRAECSEGGGWVSKGGREECPLSSLPQPDPICPHLHPPYPREQEPENGARTKDKIGVCWSLGG